MDMQQLNRLDAQNYIPSYGDFKGIVDEININSEFIHHQLGDLLAMMNEIKYHKTMQDNAKKHLNEVQDYVTPEPVLVSQPACEVEEPVRVDNPNNSCETKSVILSPIKPRRMLYHRNRRIRDEKSSDGRMTENNALEVKSGMPSRNFEGRPRYFKKWMTDEIYQMILARRRFSHAVKLHPDCKYLKSQHRFYELAVYEAIDSRKAWYFSKIRNKFRSVREERPLAPVSSSSTVVSRGNGEDARRKAQAPAVNESSVCLPKMLRK